LQKAINGLPGFGTGNAQQVDATQVDVRSRVVCTDPPYYDNIGYADLSDFFYVWLRRSLRPIFPDLFATLAVPRRKSWSQRRIDTEVKRKRKSSSSMV